MRRQAAALTALSLLVLPACTRTSSPRSALESLVAGLEAGDLAQAAVTSAGTAEAGRYPQQIKGLDGLRPEVAATGIEQVDGTRTRTSAVLEYTWRWADRPAWTYATDVSLVKEDGAWKVDWSPETLNPRLSDGDVMTARPVAATRADIMGTRLSDGGPEKLVTMREVQRVGIDKSQVPAREAEASARKLAKLLDIDADRFVAAVRAAGAQAFVEGLVIRASDTARVEKLRKDAARIDGARLVTDARPLAPTRDFAQEVLGVAGPATKEIIEKSGGQIVAGQYAGLSGIQARYDEQLRGRPGLAVRAVGADGRTRDLHEFAPENGQPLALGLDIDAQNAADKAVASIRSTGGSLVAIQPSTGRIVAVADAPGSKGYSTATAGKYAPGSTFKVVTALAMLRAGLTPDTRLDCTRTTTVDGRRFENYDDYPSSALGAVSLRTAFAHSCNTALIAEQARVSQDEIVTAAEALGLNTDPDLGYPFVLGEVPGTSSQVERAATMIGQGRVTANALGMATVVASVVKGERVTPQLLRDGPADPGRPRTPLTADEAAQLRSLMRAVTTEGSGRRFAGLPGDPVLSKTGTAEFGTTDPPKTHAWMVAAQGDLAVAVYVEEGHGGAATAGPVLERFLRAMN